MSIVDTARGTANIEAKRLVVDMSNQILLLKPKVSPLHVLSSKLNKTTAMNYKFEWMDDELMSRWTAINNGGTAYTASTTDLVVDDESIIAVNDIVKSVATGEVMRVTAINTGTHTITVTRAYGETVAAIASVANDVKLLIIGNAMMQGAGVSAEKYNSLTPNYNYTQIFKTPFSVTNTLEAVKLYGPKELARLQAKKAIEHSQSIEYALWFGERKLDTSGSQPISTTGGVLKFLAGTGNVKTISKSTGTWNDLCDWSEGLFASGSGNKVWFCSPGVITWVSKIAFGKIEIVQGDMDKTFGLDITRVLTPHGVLNMVQHPLFAQGYADYSFALDMDYVAYRPLEGRDTTLKTNVQAADEDGRRDMYITETGLELRLPATHGIMSLTT